MTTRVLGYAYRNIVKATPKTCTTDCILDRLGCDLTASQFSQEKCLVRQSFLAVFYQGSIGGALEPVTESLCPFRAFIGDLLVLPFGLAVEHDSVSKFLQGD